MAGRPIFVATHPRSCSTAFERVFMTREDLACSHEPFGDAFYYGPERLSARFADDEKMRVDSGFSNVTYKDILDKLLGEKDKRLFIKDMAYYLMPADGKPAAIAPSLADRADADADRPGRNPTVLPRATLAPFHFTFLIRHPRRSIPSYYRCTVPPLVEATQFRDFMPNEAGYAELRKLFDYLRAEGLVANSQPARGVGSGSTNGTNGTNGTIGTNGTAPVSVTVLDADDLLDRPVEAIQAFCRAVDLEYRPEMLQWSDEANQQHAAEAFEKWTGFHNDALSSKGLLPRASHRKTPTVEEEDMEWTEKFGEKGQKTIRACVEANVADYEYLKQFALEF